MRYRIEGCRANNRHGHVIWFAMGWTEAETAEEAVARFRARNSYGASYDFRAIAKPVLPAAERKPVTV